jgi:hypothetical protein
LIFFTNANVIFPVEPQARMNGLEKLTLLFRLFSTPNRSYFSLLQYWRTPAHSLPFTNCHSSFPLTRSLSFAPTVHSRSLTHMVLLTSTVLAHSHLLSLPHSYCTHSLLPAHFCSLIVPVSHSNFVETRSGKLPFLCTRPDKGKKTR